MYEQSGEYLSPAPPQQQIFATFLRHGYAPDNLIVQKKLREILDIEHQRNVGGKISNELFDEIWGQSQANSRGEVTIKAVVQVIIEAQQVLRKRIIQLQQKGGMIESTEAQILALKQQLHDYQQYYIDETAKINTLTKQLIEFEIRRKQQQFQLQSFKNDHTSLCSMFKPETRPYSTYRKQATIYIGNTKTPQIKSQQLLFILHLSWVLIILEMFLLNVRASFLPIGLYLWSFYIVMLETDENIFNVVRDEEGNKNKSGSIGYWIMAALGSIMVEMGFTVVKITSNKVIMPILHSQQTLYQWIMLILLILTVFLRIIMILLYLKLQNLSSTHLLYLQIFKYKIYLFKKEQRMPILHQTQIVYQ